MDSPLSLQWSTHYAWKGKRKSKSKRKRKEARKRRKGRRRGQAAQGEEGRGQGVKGEEGARRGAAVFVSCRCRSSPSSSPTASSPAAPAAPAAMEAEEHPPVGDGSNEGFVNLIVGVPKHMWGMIPEADRKNLVRRMAQKALKSFWKGCALLPPPVRPVVGHHHHPPLRQAPPWCSVSPHCAASPTVFFNTIVSSGSVNTCTHMHTRRQYCSDLEWLLQYSILHASILLLSS